MRTRIATRAGCGKLARLPAARNLGEGMFEPSDTDA
jgi:hypothetical protein